jgi:hypothetical protein
MISKTSVYPSRGQKAITAIRNDGDKTDQVRVVQRYGYSSTSSGSNDIMVRSFKSQDCCAATKSWMSGMKQLLAEKRLIK